MLARFVQANKFPGKFETEGSWNNKPLISALRISQCGKSDFPINEQPFVAARAGLSGSPRWESFMVKPNGRLVRVSYTHYCASTSRLSKS